MENSHLCPDTQQIKEFASQSTLKITRTCIRIPNQDHTVMNPLRYFIQRNNKNVELVGYSIPHPAEKCAELKIQFNSEEGNIKEAVIDGLLNVESLCLRLLEALETANNE